MTLNLWKIKERKAVQKPTAHPPRSEIQNLPSPVLSSEGHISIGRNRGGGRQKPFITKDNESGETDG